MIPDDLQKLTSQEKMRLAFDLYQEAAKDEAAYDLSPEQEEELKRRVEEIKKNPNDGIPWEKVKKQVGWQH